jgi:hypothetical protein
MLILTLGLLYLFFWFQMGCPSSSCYRGVAIDVVAPFLVAIEGVAIDVVPPLPVAIEVSP